MKLRVTKNSIISYPDGEFRGGTGYIVDSTGPYERWTLANFKGSFIRAERTAVASPVDLDKLSEAATSAASVEPLHVPVPTPTDKKKVGPKRNRPPQLPPVAPEPEADAEEARPARKTKKRRLGATKERLGDPEE